MSSYVVQTEPGVKLVHIEGYHHILIEKILDELNGYKGLRRPEIIHWRENHFVFIECKSSFPNVNKQAAITKGTKKRIAALVKKAGYFLESNDVVLISKFLFSLILLQPTQFKTFIAKLRENPSAAALTDLTANHSKCKLHKASSVDLILIIKPKEKIPKKEESTYMAALVAYKEHINNCYLQTIKPLFPNTKFAVVTHSEAKNLKYCI